MKNILKNKKESSLIGIDITDDAVRLVEMVSTHQTPFIKSCIKMEFSADDDSNAKLSGLSHVLSQIKTHPKKIIVALSDHVVMIKTHALDMSLTADETYLWVCQEASKYLNTPLDTVALDFEIFKQAEEKKYVRWVAIRKRDLITQAELFEKIGLNIKIVDVYSLALERIHILAIQKLNIADKCVAAVHFNKDSLLIHVLRDKNILYTATEPYKIPNSEPCQHNHTKKTINALKRAINIFLLSFPAEQVSHLLLSGHDFCAQAILKHLALPISCVDIFELFPSLTEFPKSIQDVSHEFILSAALAMRVGDEH